MTDDAQTPLREGDNQAPHKMAALTTAILELMKAGGRSTPPIGYLQAFLLVALEPGLSVKEYANRLKVSNRTMRRYLLDLGDRNQQEAPGLKLVTSRPNLFKYELTPKGYLLAHQIASAVRKIRQDPVAPAVKREAEEDWGRER
jgi:hypothetical protein